MAAKVAEVVADMLVCTTELAAILGLTARRVQQLSQDGNSCTCEPREVSARRLGSEVCKLRPQAVGGRGR